MLNNPAGYTVYRGIIDILYVDRSADSLNLLSSDLTKLGLGQLCVEISWIGSWCPVDLTLRKETLLNHFIVCCNILQFKDKQYALTIKDYIHE